MDIYSYFKSVWKHLKDIFCKKHIKHNKQLISFTKKRRKSSKKAPCLTSDQRSPQEKAFGSRVLFFILKKTKIYDLFKKYMSDPRCFSSITYSLPSLLMQGLLIPLLRSQSKNAFYDEKKLGLHFNSNIASLIQSPAMPNPKTLEDLFLNLNSQDLEPILPALFHQLLRSKFFKLHPEFKVDSSKANMPFLVAIDAQVIHTYYDYNQHPAVACPFCLKRTRGKNSWYVHCIVALSIIGEKDFQFPLFFYNVKANHHWQEHSDEKFKQECELSALPYLLEKFRLYFPHLKVHLLLDSLYAQGTTMGLCEQFKLGYIIVRKSGSLRSLNSDIEGLKKLQLPTTKHICQRDWNTEQTAYLFSDFSHKGHSFSLIDLDEKSIKKPSKHFSKVNEKSSHWQWIVNQAVKVDNVFQVAHFGRLRWHQEDFFNTLTTRGFNISHDFSRSPYSQTIWHYLIFIAFALSTLMQLSYIGYLSRKRTAIVNWIHSIFAELSKISLSILLQEPLPKQLRFWFDTS